MPERSPQTGDEASPEVGSARRGPIEDGASPPVLDAPTIRRSHSSVHSGMTSAVAATAALPVAGDRIATYALEEAIGVGGMGAVFRATDLRLDRLVALKLLPPELSTDSEAVQRFYQEARAAARLDHENIARVYTIGHDQSYHFIAFEYIEGVTIRQRVSDDGPLPVAEVINYMLQIAGALVHASQRGVVHRDIKPSNLIVTPEGRAKLVDMGLARRFERGSPVQDGLTQSGMTLGTFDYISPEQAQDPRNVDVRSDLYSLGCTMYHMLTGRPPFPEGTVLQKLLQHREEPAPDVRLLNPAVPADLSAIVLKLMAKDPDRRYQSPEALIRDLLALAGSLGLRSVSPEGLVWTPASVAPAWERHLVWGLPSMALAVVVALLVWWGESEDPSAARRAQATVEPSIVAGRPPSARPVPPSPSMSRAVEATGTGEVSATATEASGTSLVFAIRSVDELERRLADAPWGATLVLASEGPFDLKAASAGLPAPEPRDLTIRAAPGVRPVIRPNRLTEGPTSERNALLRFQGGRIVLKGIEFRIDTPESEGSMAALMVEDTDLTVVGCWFRTSAASQGTSRLEALHVRSNADGRTGRRPAPISLRESHFDGGQVAVHLEGSADVQVAECSFGPSAPASTFWLEGPSSGLNGRAKLMLHHVSVLAGNAPVFRLERLAATIRLDDSIVAPQLGVETTLVSTDDPDRLDWLGRGNLYARVRTYLQPTRPQTRWGPITNFRAWEEEPSRTRELDSDVSGSSVWLNGDPVGLSRGSDPTLAFLPDPFELLDNSTGVRIGPNGSISRPLPVDALAAFQRPASPRSPEDLAATNSRLADETIRPAEPLPGPLSVEPSPTPAPFDLALDADRSPMQRGGRTSDSPTLPETPDEGLGTTEPLESPATTSRAAPYAPLAPVERSPETTEADPRRTILTSTELRDALKQPQGPVDPLTLASGSTFDLEPQQLREGSRWIIQGEGSPNGPRPILRLRDPGLEGRELFRLESTSSLELRGVDVIVEGRGDLAAASPTVFHLLPGANLNLVGCTVTVIAGGGNPVVASIEGKGKAAGSPLDPAPVFTSVRATDCLIRSGEDVVDIAAGGEAKLRFENCVIGAVGALINGHGQSRNRLAGQIDLEMNRSTLRTAGGLLVLESTAMEPDLPTSDVRVSESILATGEDRKPLLRVNGQDAVDSVGDRVRWQGNSVAYHRIDTYRRDQSSLPGNMPLSFDRTDWGVAVGPRDTSPYHGDVGFAQPWDPERPEWTIGPDDVRLSTSSPVRTAGPDLSRIPRAPRTA